MADSSVLLEVIVEGKNIKLVQREIEELAGSIDRASDAQQRSDRVDESAQTARNRRSRDTYNNQRAIINGSLAQGRANAKLASGITSGLVPAYAEIVSNIFAVQQTFSALKNAADLSILKDNLISTGNAAGVNLPIVAQGLRDITGAALSTKDALQATANATAQGFSTDQLESLTRVAKGASSALGRDLSDALDRLVRGTAKLEPEILDELGIIVRLDEATEEYAAKLGKTANELTSFERQQAFVNAAIEQGEKKFGSIADSTDVNPYNQLAASFSDLAQVLIEFANVAITPIVKFFSQNSLALTAAVLAFVQTIANRLMPTLQSLTNEATEAIIESAQAAKELGGNLGLGIEENIAKISDSAARLPRAFEELKPKILDGTASTEELEKAQRSLNRSIGQYSRELSNATEETIANRKEQVESLTELKNSLIELTEQRKALENFTFELTALEIQQEQAEAFRDSLEGIADAKNPLEILKQTWSGITEQFSIAREGLSKLTANFDANRIAQSIWNIIANGTQLSLRGIAFSARLAGQAILSMIPFLGAALIAFDVLKSVVSFVVNLFRSTSERAREIADNFKNLDSVGLELAKTLREINDPGSFKETNALLNARVGLIGQLTSALRKAGELDESTKESVEEKRLGALKSELLLRKRISELKQFGFSAEEIELRTRAAAKGIDRLREKADKQEKEGKFNKADATLVIDSYIRQIEANEDLKRALGDNYKILLRTREAIINSKTPEETEKQVKLFEEVQRQQAGVQAAVKGIEDSFSNARKEATKLTADQKTIATPLITSFKEIKSQLAIISDANEQISGEAKDNLEIVANAFRSTYGEAVTGGKSNIEVLELGIKALENDQKAIRVSVSERKKLTAEVKKLADVSKTSAALTKAQIDLERQATLAAINGVQAKARVIEFSAQQEIARQEQALKNAQEEVRNAKAGSDERVVAENKVLAATNALADARKRQDDAIINSKAEVVALQATIISKEEETYRVTQANIAADKQVLDLQQKIAQAKLKSVELTQAETRSNLELQRALSGGGLTPEDEYNLTVAANNSKREAEAERLNIQKEGIRLEYELLNAKITFELARLKSIKNDTSANAETKKAAEEAIAANYTVLGLIEDAQISANSLAEKESEINQILWSNAEALALEKSRREDIRLSLEGSRVILERVTALSAEGVDYAYQILVLTQTRANLEADLKNAEEGSQRARQIQLDISKTLNQEMQLQLSYADRILKSNVDFANNVVSALKTTSQLNKEMAELANTNPFTGKPISLTEAFRINEQERKERLAIAQLEASIKKATIAAEFNLIKSKFELLKAELGKDGLSPEEKAVINANQRIIDQQEILNGLTIANIDKELDLLKQKNEYEKRREAVINAEAAAKAGAQILGDGQGGGLLAASQMIGAFFPEFNKTQKEKSDIEKTIEGIFGGKEVTAEDLQGATLDAILKNPEMMAEKLGAIINGNSTEIGNKVSEAITTSLATMMVNTLNAAVLNVGSPGGPADSGEPKGNQPPAVTAAIEASEKALEAPERSATVQEIMNAGTEYRNILEEANNRSREDNAAAMSEMLAGMETVVAAAKADNMAQTNVGIGTPEISAPTLPSIDQVAPDASGMETFTQTLGAARVMAQGFAADMAELGPEGQAVSNFINGGLALADSISSTISNFQAAEGAAGKAQAIMGGISSAIGAIGQMQAASSQMRIAQIDKEIAAEKQRDGKSKESLAKIAQLEKKKEQEKRKAFEQDKKMKMAQTVINTAGAIMNALMSAPFPANIALAAMAGAMGAAQLAMISSQTYSGGASGTPSVGAATAISIGERKSTVDLAKSQSASGELAYMRGEKGIGGPENFTPAFMGAKYRATGGPTTGYVVGEQGPELFVPEVPGNIVPNSQIQQAPATNVNFTITALDASGVEDILVRQRGNLIGMMREAANSYGQPFLEGVDTASYTQTAGGVTKY